MPHSSGPENQSVKQKQCCTKFNEDFKSGLHTGGRFKREGPYAYMWLIDVDVCVKNAIL